MGRLMNYGRWTLSFVNEEIISHPQWLASVLLRRRSAELLVFGLKNTEFLLRFFHGDIVRCVRRFFGKLVHMGPVTQLDQHGHAVKQGMEGLLAVDAVVVQLRQGTLFLPGYAKSPCFA